MADERWIQNQNAGRVEEENLPARRRERPRTSPLLSNPVGIECCRKLSTLAVVNHTEENAAVKRTEVIHLKSTKTERQGESLLVAR